MLILLGGNVIVLDRACILYEYVASVARVAYLMAISLSAHVVLASGFELLP